LSNALILNNCIAASGKRKKKIARFGITTSRGPSSDESECVAVDCPEIICTPTHFSFSHAMPPTVDTTIRELYNINPRPLSATIAAIIYMFVEPEYRTLGVGSLALEVISAIHSVQAVDFTVLVADDNGSGGLVRWYESNGFSKAPLMQNVLGSPDGKFGIAMISPVSVKEGFFDEVQIKWW
jgi:GNAT superfamily N-acetyltransferase